MKVEEELYRGCRELQITCISVGHRTTLRKYHDKILELDGEGGWTLSDLPVTQTDVLSESSQWFRVFDSKPKAIPKKQCISFRFRFRFFSFSTVDNF